MTILTMKSPTPASARLALMTLALSVATALSATAQTANGHQTEMGRPLRQEDVISSVIKNNDRAAAARYMAIAASRKVGPAGAWDDPMLMIGVTNLPTTWSFTEDMMTMKMVGLSQTIPYAGQKDLAAAAARMVRHD